MFSLKKIIMRLQTILELESAFGTPSKILDVFCSVLNRMILSALCETFAGFKVL